MSKGFTDIKIDSKGIGFVLKNFVLSVPPNQREYSWNEKEVSELLDDFQQCIDQRKPYHFLGTIALTDIEDQNAQVTDGQQRLATTTLILSVIRDHFETKGKSVKVNHIESSFLRLSSMSQDAYLPKLVLNLDDSTFFADQVITKPNDPKRLKEPVYDSNKRILKAIELIREKINNNVSLYLHEKEQSDRLTEWVDFISNRALVLCLQLPNDFDAYQMFETLNNRGLRTSQIDIIKNYLFKMARENNSIVQSKWSSTMGILEAIDENDVELDFMRYYVICKDGVTRSHELYEKISNLITTKERAEELLMEMESWAGHFTAVLNPSHSNWSANPQARKSLSTIKLLNVSQIKPLLLAVVAKLGTDKKIGAILSNLANWSVRILVTGSGRGSALEDAYSEAAKKITNGTITKLKQLSAELHPQIPSDVEFKEAFESLRLTKSKIARYLLRKLEHAKTGEHEPEFMPNDDEKSIDLEHVLPKNTGGNWKHIESADAAYISTKLGNMVLLKRSSNRDIQNSSFDSKKQTYGDSNYVLTSLVSKQDNWGIKEVEERQKMLASLALTAWPHYTES